MTAFQGGLEFGDAPPGWVAVSWPSGSAWLEVRNGEICSMVIDEPTREKLRSVPLQHIKSALHVLSTSPSGSKEVATDGGVGA